MSPKAVIKYHALTGVVFYRLKSLIVGSSGVFLLLAFASFHPEDLILVSSTPNLPIQNIGGVVGAWLAFAGRGGFGWAAFALPLICGFWTIRLWRGEQGSGHWFSRLAAGAFLLASAATLAALSTSDPADQVRLGGMTGYLLVGAGRYYVGATGTFLLAGCIAGPAWFLVTDADQRAFPQHLLLAAKRLVQAFQKPRPEPPSLAQSTTSTRSHPVQQIEATGRPPASELPTPSTPPAPARVRSTVVPKPKVLTSASAPPVRQAAGGFRLPSLELLTTPPPVSERQATDDLQTNAKILEETLREFGIEARCVNIDRGPAVTRYELAPAPGVKITRIVSLADDLALVLKTSSCHVVAPIPGKGLVGIDVPNSISTTVYLKDLILSREFQRLSSPLPLAIGKDVSGQPVVCDLRECPHLLVAGATGSGKTVFLNSLLNGLLYHASPDDVKFLMIDPKMVELVLFNDIPHLVAPVVTDAKRAGAALVWAVQEMERRYQLLAKVGVRNIDGYNQKIVQSFASAEDGVKPVKLPYVVIVIDELADLMMISSQDVEAAITRLAQLSRAVGLHIILATQRPSVDVITGVIKANFPARIAFQVASKVDSRTILDMNGADKLLGRGDLLFLRPGTAKPIRAQGPFMTDEEIERVVAHLKAQRPPTYDEALLAKQEKPVETAITEKDELYDMAKRLVLETGQASTSLLQRRLRLGYGRAARILDLMEQEGLIGPPQGSRPREVLVDAQSQPA